MPLLVQPARRKQPLIGGPFGPPRLPAPILFPLVILPPEEPARPIIIPFVVGIRRPPAIHVVRTPELPFDASLPALLPLAMPVPRRAPAVHVVRTVEPVDDSARAIILTIPPALPAPPSTIDFRQALVLQLATSTKLAAIVGTNLCNLYIPEDVVLPALTYRVISNPRVHNLKGEALITTARVQIGIHSKVYSDCVKGVEALRNLFDGYQGLLGNSIAALRVLQEAEIDTYDEPDDASDTGTFMIAHDYLFTYRENLPTFS